jgi:hypothetical protein
MRLLIVGVSMILASALAAWQLGFLPHINFGIAAILVVCSLYLYRAERHPESRGR